MSGRSAAYLPSRPEKPQPEAMPQQTEKLVEGIDYYLENGRFVFTEHYLRKRGYCCQSGCRHCPYGLAKPPTDS